LKEDKKNNAYFHIFGKMFGHAQHDRASFTTASASSFAHRKSNAKSIIPKCKTTNS
jgi:hypothetical protein